MDEALFVVSTTAIAGCFPSNGWAAGRHLIESSHQAPDVCPCIDRSPRAALATCNDRAIPGPARLYLRQNRSYSVDGFGSASLASQSPIL